jgi:hypothetical protein
LSTLETNAPGPILLQPERAVEIDELGVARDVKRGGNAQ